MLPSSGYFRNFACPVFADGKCNRPHCHYKHLRDQPDHAPPPVPAPLAPDNNNSACKRTYKPTPIAELQAGAGPAGDVSAGDASAAPSERPRPRHIPVPYTPYRPEPRHLPHLTTSVSRYRPSLPSLPAPSAPPAYSPTPSNAKDDGATKYTPGATVAFASPQLYSPSTSNAVPGRFSYKPTPLEKPESAVELDAARTGEPCTKKPKRDVDEISEGRRSVEDRLPKDKNDAPVGSLPSLPRDSGEKRSDRKRLEKSHRTDPSRKAGTSSRSETGSSKSKSSDGRTISKDKIDRDHSHREKSEHRHKSSSSSRSSSRSRSESGRERTSSSRSGDKKRSEEDPKKGSEKSSRSESSKSREKSNKEEKTTEPQTIPYEKSRSDYTISYCDEASLMNDEPIEELSDSDEELRTRECLKIFEEYIPTVKETVSEHSKEPDIAAEDDDTFQYNKKRVAHLSSRMPNRPVSRALPDHKANAVQLMAERTAKVKEFHKISAALNPPKSFNTTLSNLPSNNKSKIRIAHVPNVSTMLDSKKVLAKTAPEIKASTVAQTITKGQTRVAHVPNDNFADRPGVLEPKTSKIATNVRTHYLNKMIDECLRIYLTTEDAYERALQEEHCTSKKCKTIAIYKNSALLAVSRLRKEIAEADGVRKNLRNNDSNAISHENILNGKLGNTVSWSIENKYKKDVDSSSELRGLKFYENISKWILTDEQLQENGFPLPHPSNEKGRAIIYKQNEKQRPAEGNLRWCCRCHKQYRVDKRGFPTVDEECIFHPHRKYKYRGEVKYQCCSQDSSSDGCSSALCHVYDFVDYDNLRGYVTTLPKNKKSNGDHGIFALDCEMCYTTHGLDLTRVTVVDSNCKVIYESLVKPFYPIVDYNTRFSGLTEDLLKNVTTTLLEVQATFLHMFSDKTILVGHSLESDFKALKLIHNTVVDTSVIFPHKMGPPYKRALRNLTSEYLKKIIQNSVDGHDSAEDATVCMELIKWKLKEELKLR